MSNVDSVSRNVDPHKLANRLNKLSKKAKDKTFESSVRVEWETRHVKVKMEGGADTVDINTAFNKLPSEEKLKNVLDILWLFLYTPHESSPVGFAFYDVDYLGGFGPSESLDISRSMQLNKDGEQSEISIFWTAQRKWSDTLRPKRGSSRYHSSGRLVTISGESERVEDYIEAFREVGQLYRRPRRHTSTVTFIVGPCQSG